MRAYLLGGRPLHFPFLSGVLRYDCATCDAPCCKGAALGIGPSRELVTIQQAQPRSALFSVPSFFSSPVLALQSPAERCWFLDRKNRCRLERVLGREAKPSGCRLFPFVRIRSMGEAVCVLPDFSCPIGVGDAPAATGPTSHDELALEIHRALVPRAGHPELTPPRDMAWSDALALERKIVEESERHLRSTSYVPFAELQHALALAALGVDGRSGAMARVEQTARRFLGITEKPSAATVRDLVALTGTLRLSGSALPRREVAAVLTVLSLLAGVAEGMRGAERSARSLTSIFEAQLPLLYAVANLGARPIARPGVSMATAAREAGAVRPALLEVLVEIERNGRRAVADTLEDILRTQKDAFAPPLSAEAVATLHTLGRVLLRACAFVPL
jgi:Fe-S-cluster containining protein